MNYLHVNDMLHEVVHMYVRERMDAGQFVPRTTFVKHCALEQFAEYVARLAESEKEASRDKKGCEDR